MRRAEQAGWTQPPKANVARCKEAGVVAEWSCGFGKQGDGPTTLPAPVSGDVPMYVDSAAAICARSIACPFLCEAIKAQGAARKPSQRRSHS
jgi:hypothetical protein